MPQVVAAESPPRRPLLGVAGDASADGGGRAARTFVRLVVGSGAVIGGALLARRRRGGAVMLTGAGLGLYWYDAFSLAIRRYRVDATKAFRRNAGAALSAAFLALVEEEGADPASVGLKAFVIQNRVWPFLPPYLGRVAEVRLAHLAPATEIQWTRGKGVIGQCWADSRPLAIATEPIYAALQIDSEADWLRVPAETRMDLSYRDFLHIRGKYAGVVAVPIFSGSAVVGVVALDVVHGRPFEPLVTPPVFMLLEEVAAVIGHFLRSVRPGVYRHRPARMSDTVS